MSWEWKEKRTVPYMGESLTKYVINFVWFFIVLYTQYDEIFIGLVDHVY